MPSSRPSISSSSEYTTPLLSSRTLRDVDNGMDVSVPPTTHHLGPKDRTLLIRSTRKLGQLLGTIPYLVDAESIPSTQPAHPPRLARRSTLPLRSPRSLNSNKSQAPPSPGRRPHPGPHPTMRLPPSRPRRHSSASSLSSPPSSPTSSLTTPIPAPDGPSARKQKMDKLKRTLGENVPPELVFRSRDRSTHIVEPPLIAKLPRALNLWKKASNGVKRVRARSEDAARGRGRQKNKAPKRTSQSLSSEYSRPSTPAMDIALTPKQQPTSNTPTSPMMKTPEDTDIGENDLEKVAYVLDHPHDPDSVFGLLSSLPTPPPDWSYDRTQAQAPLSESSPNIANTHRRAEKLARFFGVEPHTLEREGMDKPAQQSDAKDPTLPPGETSPHEHGDANSEPSGPGTTTISGELEEPSRSPETTDAIMSSPISSDKEEAEKGDAGNEAATPPLVATPKSAPAALVPRPLELLPPPPVMASLPSLSTNSNGNGDEHPHRRSASLNTLLMSGSRVRPLQLMSGSRGLTPSGQEKEVALRRSMTPPPFGGSTGIAIGTFGVENEDECTVPRSPPPFFDSWTSWEEEATSENVDSREGAKSPGGVSSWTVESDEREGGREQEDRVEGTVVQVQVGQGGMLGRVVEKRKREGSIVNMQGVLHHLRELPGGR